MGSTTEEQLTAQAWAALSPGIAAVSQSSPVPFHVTGTSGHLPSRFPVEQMAVATAGAALLAAAALHRQRGGACDSVSVDRGHVAAAVRSERYFLLGGQPAGAGFAPLSRFWRTADGWVRTHANYPWHRAALLGTLGTSDDVDGVAAALADLPALDVEDRVVGAGGVAAAVRSADAWRVHPQGVAVAAEPLIGHIIAGDAAPRVRPAGDWPASGIRVLDLTRVIAGPVCTRFLGALGAEVLRLDPPHRPDMAPGAAADTLLGKRSAVLDLRSAQGISALDRLLDHCDAVVCGYRPGALERFGLSAGSLAERYPGLVIVYLNAWGHSGPWSGRRGFDSIVQAPTGIAEAESGTGAEPGALPCQLLDHATGYLAAAAVLDGLRRQSTDGATHVRRLSLARTALWLTSNAASPATAEPAGEPAAPPWLIGFDSAGGRVTVVNPPGDIDSQALQWPFPLSGYGADQPIWCSEDSPGDRSVHTADPT